MEAMEISRSALDVEWRRLQVIADNVANMGTTRAPDGGPYRAKRLISGPAEAFRQHLGDISSADPRSVRGVAVYDIVTLEGATRQYFEPAHPHADADGFVTAPAISQAEEMALMIKAARSYEANLVALAAAQQMYSSALQIGRSS